MHDSPPSALPCQRPDGWLGDDKTNNYTQFNAGVAAPEIGRRFAGVSGWGLGTNLMNIAREPPRIAGPIPNPKAPSEKPPAKAWDAHAHIFGPADKFPFAPGRGVHPAGRASRSLCRAARSSGLCPRLARAGQCAWL